MKLAIANKARARYSKIVADHLASLGEDVDFISSNTCNMPFVEDGEEGILEITMKVTKKDYDESMQERIDYKNKLVEQAEKKAEKERKAADKAKKKEEAE